MNAKKEFISLLRKNKIELVVKMLNSNEELWEIVISENSVEDFAKCSSCEELSDWGDARRSGSDIDFCGNCRDVESMYSIELDVDTDIAFDSKNSKGTRFYITN